MLWINVAIGALCGALAGVVAYFLSGKNAENKRRKTVIFTIAFAVFFGIARTEVIPKMQAGLIVEEADEVLVNNPAFVAIKQYDPQTYSQIMADIRTAVEKGQNKESAVTSVRGKILSLVQNRLPKASNEAAVAYMDTMLEEMILLQKQGGDICFGLLFPQPGQPTDISPYIPESLRQSDMDGLKAIIETAATAPQPMPSESEITVALVPIIEGMAKQFGEDIAMLQAPFAPGVDKAKVCEMTIYMYSRILALPEHQSGKLLRYLFAHS